MTINQLTKEWLQQTIAELESVRDEIPFGIDTNSELELAAFKMALAAMDNETVGNEFIPKNLDKALGVVGMALPESKEEFNFQIERWIQRLIDRVIRYADEFKGQPAPVVPDGYVMVPIEPTMSQELAGYKTLNDTGRMSRLMKTRLSNIYRAMLAAAPQEVK